MLENKKIFVLGLARSGLAVAKLLSKKNEILVTDKNYDDVRVNELKDLNVSFIQSETGEELIDSSYDLLIKNPGISSLHPCVKKAKELNIEIVNEMEVAFKYLKNNVKIIGITGSNGKTTTSTILYDLLKLHNKEVTLGGNIGIPLSDIVENVSENSILVLEISDHQLKDFKDFKTDISILTNLYQTHLDFHDGYENYKLAKKKIFNHHDKDNIALINYSNLDSMNLTKDINSSKIYFNNEDNYVTEEGIYINKELIIGKDDIKLTGLHNYENILCALLILQLFAFDIDVIKKYLKEFNGVEHRIERVFINKNILVYNDSKSTNPTSTIIALKMMKDNVHLILGGFERSQDFNELNDYLDKVKCIYGIGEVTDRVYDYAVSKNKECYKCYNLKEALLKVKEVVKDGETILLSPASASWDQYDKFETRGEEFKKIILDLYK